MQHALTSLLLATMFSLSGCGSSSTPKPQERQEWRLDQSAPATDPNAKRSPKVEMRLPDPPSGPSTPPSDPAPPAAPRSPAAPTVATSPSAPSTPNAPTAPSTPPFEFHVQFSVQEHLPTARGLKGTIRLPQGLPIFENRVLIVYEWRPEDGKEKRINPRTGQPYGPIWRPTLAEQMQPEHLARHLATMEQWLVTWVPRSFDGVVCLDVEAWPLKGDEFHLGRAYQDDLARRAPGKKQSELMAEFIRVTQARARELRPNVKAWGWWGMGIMHPAWPVWKPEQYAAWKSGGLEVDALALQNIQAPMPVFYYPTQFTDAKERAEAWERIKQNWIAMYGRERLSRDGYAYLNARHDDGPRKNEALTREEFRECLEQARSLGMRRFIIWDSVDTPQRRDTIQKFLDTAVRPEVEALLAREPADGRTPAEAAPAQPTPTPATRPSSRD